MKVHSSTCPMNKDAPLMLLGSPCTCEAKDVDEPTAPTSQKISVPDIVLTSTDFVEALPEGESENGQTTPTSGVFCQGNTLQWLDELMGVKFDGIVTSVPYWGQRRYMPGYKDELGTEDLQSYLENMSAIFGKAYDLLADDGLLWLNIGDAAVGSGGAGGDYNKGGTYEDRDRYKQGRPTTPTGELAKGQWANVPARLSIRLQEEGWLLRSSIVWAKLHPRRESLAHVRRPKVQHEMIYLFSKSRAQRTNFDPEGTVEPGDVWHVDVARGDEANGKAPWPTELVERMLACMKPGAGSENAQTTPTFGMVLDPFVGGSGSLYKAGKKLGWTVYGIDADEDAFNTTLAECPWVQELEG